MDDIARLKKQLRLLAIATITLGIATLGLLVAYFAGSKSNQAWPDLTAGKLTVKEVHVVSPDGQVRMILDAHSGTPNLVLLDEKTEVRVVLDASAKLGGTLNILGPEKANKVLISSGFILMGDEMQSNLRLVAPSAGGPSLVVRDENGFSTTVGRTTLKDKQDGTQSLTSAAYIVASSTESSQQYPLLKVAVKPK
jgi:hypothetical protein